MTTSIRIVLRVSPVGPGARRARLPLPGQHEKRRRHKEAMTLRSQLRRLACSSARLDLGRARAAFSFVLLHSAEWPTKDRNYFFRFLRAA